MRLASSYTVFMLSLSLAACGGKDPGSTDASAGPGTTGSASTGNVDPTTSGSSTGVATTGTASSVSTTGTGEPGTSGTSTTAVDPGTSTGTSTGEPGTTTGPGEGSSGDTGVVPGGECVADKDCTLHNDCCDCFAVPKVDDPPICKKACDQPMCDVLGIDQVTCRFGTCVTEKLPCDASKVACDSLPPDCPDGQVATVKGACWSGSCVPAVSCDVVTDCKLCPAGFMCVFKEAQVMNLPTCEPVPAPCDGKIDCACAGAEVCVDEFNACNAGPGNELHCSCPAC